MDTISIKPHKVNKVASRRRYIIDGTLVGIDNFFFTTNKLNNDRNDLVSILTYAT